MKWWRVVRGRVNRERGERWGVGYNLQAPTAREAVAQNARNLRQGAGWEADSFAPVLMVYELVPVPEGEWY